MRKNRELKQCKMADFEYLDPIVLENADKKSVLKAIKEGLKKKADQLKIYFTCDSIKGTGDWVCKDG